MKEMEIVAKECNKACRLEGQGKVEQAIVLYKRCAERGSTTAMAALGRIYNTEPFDAPAQSHYWLNRCIEHGPCIVFRTMPGSVDFALASAYGLLGQLYRHGIGCKKDTDRALSLLQRGAEDGEDVSQNNYGSLLASVGRHTEAVHWYQAAAEAGYPLGMANLAACMINGIGMHQDLKTAEEWLRRAQGLGLPQASIMLAKLLHSTAATPVEFAAVVTAMDRAIQVQRAANDVQTTSLCHQAEFLLDWQRSDDEAMLMADFVCLLSPPPTPPPRGASSAELFQYGSDLRRRYLRERPLTDREKRAGTFFEEAMGMGDAAAGVRYGHFLLSRGFTTLALDVFEQTACTLKDPEALYMAGSLLKGKPKGTRYLTRASKMGYQPATELLNCWASGLDPLDMQQPEFARKDLKGREGVVRAHIDQTFAESSSDIPENEANAIKNFMISMQNAKSAKVQI